MKFINFLGKLLFILSIFPFIGLVVIFVMSFCSSPLLMLLSLPIFFLLWFIIASCLQHHPTKEQKDKFEKYYDDWVNIRRK